MELSLGPEWALLSLFLGAFLASTLLPGGSELLFLYLTQQPGADTPLLLCVATLGNTLGGMTSWLLGRWLAYRWPGRALREGHRLAVVRVERYGPLLLLLSWVPLVGDPLCVAAGWLRIHWAPALLFIALGKAARYAVLLWLSGG